MAAGAKHYETAILYVKAGSVLVIVLVIDDLAELIGRREVRRIAAEAVPHGVFDASAAGNSFDGPALDLAGGKGVAGDHRRRFGEHCRTISAFAVLRLMTRSNFVACWIGKSPGFAPPRIRATYPATRR
jgi:hypothetical protein